MEPESNLSLEEISKLVRENNEILKSMKKSQRLSQIMRIIYWLFLIGTAFGAYYFIQPYIDSVKDLYGGASDSVNRFNSLF